MRIEQTARVFGLTLTLALSACGSVLQAPDSGTDARTDCGQLNEAACRARTDCAVGTCEGACGGPSGFFGCYDPSREPPPSCPDSGVVCPAPCSALTDAASCAARADCRANSCPTCDGSSSFFTCVPIATSAILCPAIACPAACSIMTTQASCDARPDCHSVFVDPGTCGCAAVGCCAHFSACATGKAMCTPPAQVTCKIVTPYCEGPAYVLSYTSNCYEGCVPAAACGVN
jgi:hypothetical protein